MPRCPNCQFILVFLEHRLKYKCAKCGKLFLQKQIEDIEFRKWNEEQRKKDNEKPKKSRMTEEERKQLAKNWRENNRDKLKVYEQKWRTENKEKYNKIKRGYYHKTLESARIYGRMKYYRKKQVELAVGMLENEEYRAYIKEILSTLPTLVLSEVL